jgi:hypothetical protein
MPTDCYNLKCKGVNLNPSSKQPTGNYPMGCISQPENKDCSRLNLNKLTRTGDDICYTTSRNVQNDSIGNYMVTAFKDCECAAKNVDAIAMSEPTITYRDGYGWTSVDGCNIDADSSIRNANNLTNMRYIQQLYTRPYATVPYMGRGSGNSVLESVLQTGEDTSQKKQCNTLSGIYIDRFVPMVPCLAQNVQNPVHLVEEVAATDWIRGGIPSRDIVRNTNFLLKCGYVYNGKLWQRPDGKNPNQILS